MGSAGGVCGLWSCEGLWSDLLLLDGLLGRRALQEHAALLRRLAWPRALRHRRTNVDLVREQRLRHLAELRHLTELPVDTGGEVRGEATNN